MLMLVLAACGDATATTAPATTAPVAATTAPAAATTAPAAATTAPAAATTAPAAATTAPAGATTAPVSAATTAPVAATTAPVAATTAPASTGSGDVLSKLVGTFTPDTTDHTGGTIVYGYGGQGFDILNPYYANASSTLSAVTTIFDPLVQLNNKAQYYPDLIQEVPTLQNGGVKVAADNKSMDITIKLKPNLVWSDGEPITSKDIAYTVKWLVDPGQTGITADTGAYANITSVDTPDAQTAIYHMKALYGPYLNLLTMQPLPEHIWSKIPINADIAKNKEMLVPTVVSGPFMVKEAVPDQKVTLVRNDKYKAVFGKVANLDSIVFQVTADTTTATASLKKGEIDNLQYLQEPDLKGLTGAAGLV